VNLALVMLIGGLWHGSSWTFVLWGGWHGALLVFERLLGVRAGGRVADRPFPWLPRPVAVALTSIAVAVGWVVFRAPGLPAALGMYAGMIGLHGPGLSAEMAWQLPRLSLWMLGAAMAAAWLGPWLAGRLAKAGRLARVIAGNAWLVLLPLFVLGILKIMAESYAPVLYARF
jgi:alginate O-acetyltransferase complex protein AlgI